MFFMLCLYVMKHSRWHTTPGKTLGFDDSVLCFMMMMMLCGTGTGRYERGLMLTSTQESLTYRVNL